MTTINAGIIEVRRNIYNLDAAITSLLQVETDRERVERTGAEIFEKVERAKDDLIALATNLTIPDEDIQNAVEFLNVILKRLLVTVFQMASDEISERALFVIDRPSALDVLQRMVVGLFPGGSIGEDLDRQIVVYTNLREDGNRLIDIDTKERWNR